MASADDFTDVDPVELAKSIEKLAEAWSIEIAVAEGATDDFANDELFQVKEPGETVEAILDGGNQDATIEKMLLGLGTGSDTSFEIDKVGRR